MKVRIQTQGFTLTPTIGAHVHARLSGLFSRHDEDIMAVDVYLKDLNGPKGGYDKQIVIRVQLRYLGPVNVTTTHTDLYQAIDICSRRTLRSVRRAIGRRKMVRRRGLQTIAEATSSASL